MVPCKKGPKNCVLFAWCYFFLWKDKTPTSKTRSGGNSIHNPNLERRGSGSAGVPGNNIGGGRSSGATGASAGASVPPPSPRPLIRVPSRGSLDDLRRPLSSRNLQVQSRYSWCYFGNKIFFSTLCNDCWFCSVISNSIATGRCLKISLGFPLNP